MPKLEFTLKVITPAFVAGATTYHVNDPDVQISIHSDALRIPSLKGVLRFWYRTLFAYRPPEYIKTCEESVFGSTRTGQGFRLRLIDVDHARYGNVDTNFRNQLKYLGYGPFGERKAILPGATFRFVATGDV
ncbi:MAG: type III-B CRISPR module RAMP protein Cmr1, partial [Methanobacteriota archaeon]